MVEKINQSSEESVIKLACGEHIFTLVAHSALHQSPVFSNAFNGSWKESTTSTIQLDEYHSSTVESLVEFLNQGLYHVMEHDYHNALEHHLSVCDLADYLLMPPLLSFANSQIKLLLSRTIEPCSFTDMAIDVFAAGTNPGLEDILSQAATSSIPILLASPRYPELPPNLTHRILSSMVATQTTLIHQVKCTEGTLQRTIDEMTQQAGESSSAFLRRMDVIQLPRGPIMRPEYALVPHAYIYRPKKCGRCDAEGQFRLVLKDDEFEEEFLAAGCLDCGHDMECYVASPELQESWLDVSVLLERARGVLGDWDREVMWRKFVGRLWVWMGVAVLLVGYLLWKMLFCWR